MARPPAYLSRTPSPTPVVRFDAGGVTDAEKAQFVKLYLPLAKNWEQRSGIPASVLVGWGASETNWGRAGGLFGVKGKSPSGQSATYATHEYIGGRRVDLNDEFAVYANPEEGFQHLMSLLQNQRYGPAYAQFQRDGNVASFLAGIQQAGYATDVNWPRNVLSLSNTVNQVAETSGAARLPAATTQPTTTPTRTQVPSVQTQQDPRLLGMWQQAGQDYEAAVAHGKELERQLNSLPGGIDNPKYLELWGQYDRNKAQQSAYAKNYIELGKLTGAYQSQSPADTQKDALSLGVAQYNANKDGLASLMGILGDGITQNNTVDRLLFDRLRAEQDALVKGYDLAVKNREISMTDAVQRINAQALQQAAEVVWLSKMLEVAGFIEKGRSEQRERMLPPGTEHELGYAPNSPINQMLEGLGLPKMVIRAKQVPNEWVDPLMQLGQARGVTEATLPHPAYDVAGVKAAADLAKPPVPNLPGYLANQPFRQADLATYTLPGIGTYADALEAWRRGDLSTLTVPQPATQAAPVPLPPTSQQYAIPDDQRQATQPPEVSAPEVNPYAAKPDPRTTGPSGGVTASPAGDSGDGNDVLEKLWNGLKWLPTPYSPVPAGVLEFAGRRLR